MMRAPSLSSLTWLPVVIPEVGFPTRTASVWPANAIATISAALFVMPR